MFIPGMHVIWTCPDGTTLAAIVLSTRADGKVCIRLDSMQRGSFAVDAAQLKLA
jgi:hypothetical protein